MSARNTELEQKFLHEKSSPVEKVIVNAVNGWAELGRTSLTSQFLDDCLPASRFQGFTREDLHALSTIPSLPIENHIIIGQMEGYSAGVYLAGLIEKGEFSTEKFTTVEGLTPFEQGEYVGQILVDNLSPMSDIGYLPANQAHFQDRTWRFMGALQQLNDKLLPGQEGQELLRGVHEKLSGISAYPNPDTSIDNLNASWGFIKGMAVQRGLQLKPSDDILQMIALKQKES
ncbi:hypothetical protein KBC75_05230 [Candidatus Shapirobacteria bacterium]|nr:hypothetical protein [Candidatus Shapirobacteria bacterium]